MRKKLMVRKTPQTKVTKFNSEKSQFWRDCDQHYKSTIPLRAERRRLFKQAWPEWLNNEKVKKREALGLQPYAQGRAHPGPYSYTSGGVLRRASEIEKMETQIKRTK